MKVSGFSIAVDLGTTTLAASLVNAETGERLAMTGAMNAQRPFGADVVSRLDVAVKSSEMHQDMTRIIREQIDFLIREVCRLAGIARHDVDAVAIAGNPAMQHLFMGLPVESLAYPPYRPLFTGGKFLDPAELDWEGRGEVYLFPMPGGFVGGDTVAFLYGQLANCLLPPDPALFLDMGTNGEIVLSVGTTLWATSAAAGPAFEGGNLSSGMVALPGAINSVRVDGDRIRIDVIGKEPPKGICGSAVLETIVSLLEHGILEKGGRIRSRDEIPSNLASRIIEHDGEVSFVLYRDSAKLILLTQGDVRQIQMAKSAIRAGMDVLAERSRIRFNALKDVVLTGSFGAVLLPEWLKTIGIFDEGMVQNTRFVNEGALCGVERALSAHDRFKSVEALAEKFRVVPLSGTPVFEKLFMQNINFPT